MAAILRERNLPPLYKDRASRKMDQEFTDNSIGLRIPFKSQYHASTTPESFPC
jgi:hypothetical protein